MRPVVLLLCLAALLPIAASEHDGDHLEAERSVQYGGAGAVDACVYPAAEGIVSTCLEFGRASTGGWLTVSESSPRLFSLAWKVCYFDASRTPLVTSPLVDSLTCEQLNPWIVDSYETWIPVGAAMASVSPIGGEDVELRLWAYLR